MSECTIWVGGTNPKGYGSAWHKGKYIGAHRLAWIQANGPIPKGLCVCHHCDNPSCINPEHLFLGTVADNNRDKARKGRASRRGATKAKNGLRECTACHVIKPVSEFHQSQKSRIIGAAMILKSKCKECQNAWNRVRYHKRKQLHKSIPNFRP